jgi:integral membrane sensor domain MASE1
VANSTGALLSPSTLMRAGFFGLAYYLGARAGLALVVQPECISALWPANPVAVALVLLSPPRMWPAYFLALFPGLIWAALRFGPRDATA